MEGQYWCSESAENLEKTKLIGIRDYADHKVFLLTWATSFALSILVFLLTLMKLPWIDW